MPRLLNHLGVAGLLGVALVLSLDAAERGVPAVRIPGPSVQGPLQCEMGRDYWLHFPHGYDPEKTYWLVACAGGEKDYRLPGTRTDYIVVSPVYPRSAQEGYFQILGGQSDTQLIRLFERLRGIYRLHERLFLWGFSAGAQFSHRFTMAHPDLVAGLSAHSAGSWGPQINQKAAGIPLFLSCGLDDIDPSVAGAPPRIICAETYFHDIRTNGMLAKMRYWEGVGHSVCNQVFPLTAECFELATVGLFPKQREAIEAELTGIDGMISEGKTSEARKAMKDLMKLSLSMPSGKTQAWISLTPEQRNERRAEFVTAGIGGRSKLNREFWIDDSAENEYGWNESLISRSAQLERARAGWLTEQIKQRLDLLKVRSKAEVKTKAGIR